LLRFAAKEIVMTTTIVFTILIPGLILFFFLNLAARELSRKFHEMKRQAEREEALAESLRLDFTRESKTLKRVEVKEPVARILCVDDEEVILDSLRKVLVLDGYSVDTVETGQEALGLVQTRDYDFVFTDLKMPSMSGTDVAKSVKHLRPDIDVVIITGFATVESAVECMKHGAMDYIEKPFTEDELRRFVRHALIRRQDRIQKQLKPRVHVSGRTEGGRAPEGEFSIPGGALISSGHCWASLAEDGTARIGLDDFAGKLLGRVDAIELPEVGKTVKAGERLFSVGQNHRQAHFLAPLSGKVVKVNTALREEPESRENLSYGQNWVCVVEGEDLDAELPDLKIGKSAVAFFQEEIDRFKAFLQKARGSAEVEPTSLCMGAFQDLDDAQWEAAAKEFFGR
jgi:CheY-like chemotaxis protein/glycine cleavage system H lipoate-binding protein